MANKKSKNSNNNKQGKQKQKQGKSNVVGRAQTSISVRGTIPAGGSRQETMIMPVKGNSGSFILHCAGINWLKGVAKSYQRWNLSNLKVWYEPSVGTSTNGVVHLAHQLDLADATPTSVDQISAISGASRAAVWEDNRRLVVPKRGKAMAYSSPSNFQLMDSSDQNDHCLGRVCFVADVDANQFSATDPVPVGYVWISYNPVLLDPIDPDLNE